MKPTYPKPPQSDPNDWKDELRAQCIALHKMGATKAQMDYWEKTGEMPAHKPKPKPRPPKRANRDRLDEMLRKIEEESCREAEARIEAKARAAKAREQAVFTIDNESDYGATRGNQTRCPRCMVWRDPWEFTDTIPTCKTCTKEAITPRPPFKPLVSLHRGGLFIGSRRTSRPTEGDEYARAKWCEQTALADWPGLPSQQAALHLKM